MTASASKRFIVLKQAQNKKSLVDAFNNYISAPAKYEKEFYDEVKKFAYRKLYHFEIENSKLGTTNTVDDYAQDVVVGVWTGLKSFCGDADSFCSWVNKIIFNTGVDFLDEIVEQRENKVGILIEKVDEDGKQEQVDNSAIYETEINDHFITIPNSVQGIDLNICKVMMSSQVQDQRKDGSYFYRPKNYAEVAEILNMTEQAVKDRVAKLKKRLKVEREAKDKHSAAKLLAAQAEQRDSLTNGLARIRSQRSIAATQHKT
jgi:RNA polymerase sigma factor (sigma-70 family)